MLVSNAKAKKAQRIPAQSSCHEARAHAENLPIIFREGHKVSQLSLSSRQFRTQ